MKLTHKQTKGFTLVELLVVIAIIAVLAGIATPAILRGLEKAKIARSSAVCAAFETAVIAFENEYNYLPYGGSDAPDEDNDPALISNTGDGAELMLVLAGAEEELNFKEIRFFELDEPRANKNGLRLDNDGGDPGLYDPWGQGYRILMDYDFDGGIEHPYDSDEVLSRKAVMFSVGPDGEFGDPGTNRDNPSNFR